MLLTWPMLIAGLAGMTFVLLRMGRRMQVRRQARRQGALMQHLDWTRQPDSRRPSQKKGLIAQILG